MRTFKGNQGNIWKPGEVTLVSKKPFRVLIEGVRGRSYTGDISLDDMFFQDGNCVGTCSSVLPTARINCGYLGISAADCILKKGCCYDTSNPNVPSCYYHPATCDSIPVVARHDCVPGTKITSQYYCKQKGCCFDNSRPNAIKCFKHPRQPTPFPTTPPPTLPPKPAPGDCDFETDLCKWFNHADNHVKWQRQRGGTPSYKTGPKVDHTLGTDQGMSRVYEINCLCCMNVFMKQWLLSYINSRAAVSSKLSTLDPHALCICDNHHKHNRYHHRPTSMIINSIAIRAN